MRTSCVLALVVVALPGVTGLSAQSVSNGTFDSDVAGWTAALKSTVAWDALDAEAGSSSGSALVTNQSDTSNDSSGATQCIEGLVGEAIYRFSSEIRIPGGQSETGRAHLLIQWYGGSCGGQQSGNPITTSGVSTSAPDTWTTDRGTAVAPEGTQSAQLRLSVWKDQATGSLSAHFDNVSFGLAAEHLALVPAAGLASGDAGSFWVTDLDVNNPGTSTMTYSLWWLPRGGDNFEPMVSAAFMLNPGQSRRHEDVVGQVFGLDPADAPFGAVAVASDGPGAIAMARVFNRPGGGGGGTFGQSMPAVASDAMIPKGERRRIVFMSEDADFRANLGCQNGTGNDIRINVRLMREAGVALRTLTMDLPAFSNTQLNRVFEDWSPVRGYADVWSDTVGAVFTCYGSVLDALSSDPTTILPQ